MDPKPRITAKDFFLHIGIIASLYVFATSLLSFLFDIINYVFPDRQAFYADPYSGSLRFALSTLIVSFPLMLVLLRVVHTDLTVNIAKRDLGLRKWLIYLTFFITLLTVAIDLIVLLNTFLGGEITTRFVLKVVAVIVVAGGIFWATLADLRGVFFAKPAVRKISLAVAIILVLASIVWGFIVIGSPTTFRNIRDDNQRTIDLQNIQWQIVNQYQSKGALPKSLGELTDSISSYVTPKDPATNIPYEYATVATTTAVGPTFSLCSTFAEKSQDLKGRGEYVGGMSYPVATDAMYPPVLEDSTWSHAAGHVCFTRSIDPTKYPINKTK